MPTLAAVDTDPTAAAATSLVEAALADAPGRSRLERRRDELGLLGLEHRATVGKLIAQAASYGLDLNEYQPLRQALAAATRCRDLTTLTDWERHGTAC